MVLAFALAACHDKQVTQPSTDDAIPPQVGLTRAEATTCSAGSAPPSDDLDATAFHTTAVDDPQLQTDDFTLAAVSDGLEVRRSDGSVLTKIAYPAQPTGGSLTIGANGTLYVGTPAIGDDDAQRLDTQTGKVLAIDSATGIVSVFAYGFHAPQCAYDAGGPRALWCADIGGGNVDEVNVVAEGLNYGWPYLEGSTQRSVDPSGLASEGRPMSQYKPSAGSHIVGGGVYRGRALQELVGTYVFADSASGDVSRVATTVSGTVDVSLVLATGEAISSLHYDEQDELYVEFASGVTARLDGDAGDATFPRALSATRCFADLSSRTAAAGVLAYSVRVPFWSSGEDKLRFFALPDGTSTITPAQTGAWTFPVGTILLKEFTARVSAEATAEQPIETRMLVQRTQDVWEGYIYQWNDDTTDAYLIVGGKTMSYTLDGAAHAHIFPTRAECNTCHNDVAGFLLGMQTPQLNCDVVYDDGTQNQITALEDNGWLSAALDGDPSTWEQFASGNDTSATLDDRARSYLAANCAQCHRAGGLESEPDLRYDLSFDDTHLCARDTDGVQRFIVPGHGAESPIITERMTQLGPTGMPPIGKSQVDETGVALISAWIDAMPEDLCN